ncbi:ATP-binding protein [Streptomyces sp. NPDC032198]|uniref:AAA family ATPase n=1 Tax=Streptomyces sp. NPDC032198 TaxID=3155127 RepID=UPI0033CC3787
MTDTKPVVFLLVGLPGSGKSTYAQALQRQGVFRLSVDERMVAHHGRLGEDYPEERHLALLAPVVESVCRELVELVAAGLSVVFDHGLGTRAEREKYKQLVVGLGARWRLVHFPVEHSELLRRLAARGQAPGIGQISPEALAWIAEHSEEPCGEGEELPEPKP